MKDFRNIELQVGDTIAYAGRQSSSMWLREAIVKELNLNRVKVQPLKNRFSWYQKEVVPKAVWLHRSTYIVKVS